MLTAPEDDSHACDMMAQSGHGFSFANQCRESRSCECEAGPSRQGREGLADGGMAVHANPSSHGLKVCQQGIASSSLFAAIASRPHANNCGGYRNILPLESHMWRKRSRKLGARM